MVNMKLN